ncbi:MAG: TonB-dependent receptor, partial [Spirochaetales bacterium]|nr:TonB-dependent receptor [Spirochaetales bacterium]
WNVFGSISNLSYYPGQYYYKKNKNKTQTAAMDLFDTQEISTGFSMGNDFVYGSASATIHRAANHFLYKDDSNKTRRRVNNEVYDAAGNASLQFSLPYDMQLMISENIYYGDKNIPGVMTSTVTGKQKDFLNKTSAVLKMEKVGTERVKTELLTSYKFDQIDYEEPGTDSLHNLHTVNVINRWDFDVTSWLNLSADGDFTFNYLDSTDCGQVYRLDGGASVTAEFSIGNHVQLIPSVKLIYYKEYPIVTPKLGALFFLPAGFTIKANFYRMFKQPSFNQLYWGESATAKGNPNLRCEDGWGGDVILEYEKSGILKADSSFYVNYYMDKIQWSTNSDGQWTPTNIGKAIYFGSDNSLSTDLPTFVQFGLDYNFVLTYLLSYGLSLEDDRRIMYTPVHSLSAHVDFSWKTGMISLIGKYTSERYTSNMNISSLPPYFTFDVSFEQNIGKYFTVFAAVKNMLNAYYFETEGYPMPGGSVTVGVRVQAGGDWKKTE